MYHFMLIMSLQKTAAAEEENHRGQEFFFFGGILILSSTVCSPLSFLLCTQSAFVPVNCRPRQCPDLFSLLSILNIVSFHLYKHKI